MGIELSFKTSLHLVIMPKALLLKVRTYNYVKFETHAIFCQKNLIKSSVKNLMDKVHISNGVKILKVRSHGLPLCTRSV